MKNLFNIKISDIIIFSLLIIFMFSSYSVNNYTGRYILGAIFILFSISSFEKSAFAFSSLIIFYFLYYYWDMPEFRFTRVAGIVIVSSMILHYYFISNKINNKRSYKKSHILSLILLSIFLLKISNMYVEIHLLETPFLKSLARFSDFLIFFIFILLLYNAYNKKYIKKYINEILYLSMLLGLLIFGVVINNPQLLYFSQEYGYLNDILWNSVYFGHKQVWGMFFVGVFFSSINLYNQKKIFFYVILTIFSSILVLVSLSRVAYISLVISIFIYLLLGTTGKRKILYLLLTIFFILIMFQLDFFLERIKPLLDAFNSYDKISYLQKYSSGHLSDRAFAQYIENLTLIPNMFYKHWEYNYSEGFWNGVLFQLGIIGVIFVLAIYGRVFFSVGGKVLKMEKQISVILISFAFVSFISGFITREIYFSDYYGIIRGFGFIWLLFLLYAEKTMFANYGKNFNY